MKRLLPKTLFGQTVLILLLGIGLTLLAGNWIYSTARQEAVRAVGALASAERIINVSRLVGEVPSEWRQRLIAGSNDAAFRVSLSLQRPAVSRDGADSQAGDAIAEFLRAALPSSQISVSVTTTDGLRMGPGFDHGPGPGFGPGFHGPPGAGPMQGPFARAAMSWRGLQAAIQLADGQWLSFSTSLPESGPAMSPWLMFTLLVMATMIALVTALAARRMTAPLGVLAEAAERLGRNVDAAPLARSGSVEMARASDAFNQMQFRLRRLIENRTLMLAAISHDLRTPSGITGATYLHSHNASSLLRYGIARISQFDSADDPKRVGRTSHLTLSVGISGCCSLNALVHSAVAAFLCCWCM